MINSIPKIVKLTLIGLAAIVLFYSPLFAANTFLGAGTATVYKVTLKKIELRDDVKGWVTVFEGIGAVVDIASASGGEAAGNFVSALAVPDGDYNDVKVTPWNTFTISGSVAYSGSTYYTTATLTTEGFSQFSNTASDQAECTVTIPVAQVSETESIISPQIRVRNGVADHKLRVNFSLTSALNLVTSTDPSGKQIWPVTPTVTIVTK